MTLDDATLQARESTGKTFRLRADEAESRWVLELQWRSRGEIRAAAVPVPSPEACFVRYEFDPDGHAFQRVEIGGETARLFPVLDPVSMEHAMEVERTILPAIYQASSETGGCPGLARAHDFAERFQHWVAGEASGLEPSDPAGERVFEIAKGDVNEATPAPEIRRRAFLRYYQYALCDDDAYRAKARESLQRLMDEAAKQTQQRLTAMIRRLEEEGFREAPA